MPAPDADHDGPGTSQPAKQRPGPPPRPVPVGFVEVYLRGGWDEAQAVFGCHRRTLSRWLNQAGFDRLTALRRAYRSARAMIAARARRTCPRLNGQRSRWAAIRRQGDREEGWAISARYGPSERFRVTRFAAREPCTGFCIRSGDDAPGAGFSPVRFDLMGGAGSLSGGGWSSPASGLPALRDVDGGRAVPVDAITIIALADAAEEAGLTIEGFLIRLRWRFDSEGAER